MLRILGNCGFRVHGGVQIFFRLRIVRNHSQMRISINTESIFLHYSPSFGFSQRNSEVSMKVGKLGSKIVSLVHITKPSSGHLEPLSKELCALLIMVYHPLRTFQGHR